MNKYMIDKRKVITIIKRECVLVIALTLAFLTSFFSLPKIEYIDFKVLILLFNLMIVVAAFSELQVLDNIAVFVLQRCKSYRDVSLALVFTTFIASMIFTNDVALITFVPLTLIIGKKANIKVMKIIIFQTLAANLGSSLTPMGNPQNLFIYSFYNISPVEFLKLTFPIAALAIVFLAGIILKWKNEDLKFQLDDISVGNRIEVFCFSILFVIILFSVFYSIDYKVAFIITVIMVFLLKKSLFLKVDYFLLLNFVGFFLFIGNISNMYMIKNFMEGILSGGTNTYFAGVLSSQLISNVPATMLLSGFTHYYKELLLAVNVGGMGTLIASLASLIAYKLYIKEYREKSREYIRVFTIYNVMGLAIFIPIIYILTCKLSF